MSRWVSITSCPHDWDAIHKECGNDWNKINKRLYKEDMEHMVKQMEKHMKPSKRNIAKLKRNMAKLKSCGGNNCKYYSNPFIDNHFLECLHSKTNYSYYLQKDIKCPGFTSGIGPIAHNTFKYRWLKKHSWLRKNNYDKRTRPENSQY